MPLLVSVRSGEEVPAALAVAAQTPRSVPLSVALGDFAAEEEVRRAVSAVRLPKRDAAVYFKLGFAEVASVERVVCLLRMAVATATAGGSTPDIVGVAYADHRAA